MPAATDECGINRYESRDLSELPVELWQLCLSYVDTSSLLKICLVSRRYFRLSLDQLYRDIDLARDMREPDVRPGPPNPHKQTEMRRRLGLLLHSFLVRPGLAHLVRSLLFDFEMNEHNTPTIDFFTPSAPDFDVHAAVAAVKQRIPNPDTHFVDRLRQAYPQAILAALLALCPNLETLRVGSMLNLADGLTRGVVQESRRLPGAGGGTPVLARLRHIAHSRPSQPMYSIFPLFFESVLKPPGLVSLDLRNVRFTEIGSMPLSDGPWRRPGPSGATSLRLEYEHFELMPLRRLFALLPALRRLHIRGRVRPNARPNNRPYDAEHCWNLPAFPAVMAHLAPTLELTLLFEVPEEAEMALRDLAKCPLGSLVRFGGLRKLVVSVEAVLLTGMLKSKEEWLEILPPRLEELTLVYGGSDYEPVHYKRNVGYEVAGEGTLTGERARTWIVDRALEQFLSSKNAKVARELTMVYFGTSVHGMVAVDRGNESPNMGKEGNWRREVAKWRDLMVRLASGASVKFEGYYEFLAQGEDKMRKITYFDPKWPDDEILEKVVSMEHVEAMVF